jgi:hypothetical protein
MGHLNMTELFEFPPILTDVLSDFLSDRPKSGGGALPGALPVSATPRRK